MHGITSPASHPAPSPAGLAALGGRLSADVQQDAAHVYQQLMGLSFTEDELSGAVLLVRGQGELSKGQAGLSLVGLSYTEDELSDRFNAGCGPAELCQLPARGHGLAWRRALVDRDTLQLYPNAPCFSNHVG